MSIAQYSRIQMYTKEQSRLLVDGYNNLLKIKSSMEKGECPDER